MHPRLPYLVGSTLILAVMAIVAALTPPQTEPRELASPGSYASAAVLAPPVGRSGGDDRATPPRPEAAPQGWSSDWIASLSSGDCKGIASGDRSWCDTNDCKGIASGDRSWCSSNDCKGVASKDRSWCRTSLCKGWASGDRTWCDSGDCKGVASKDRSWCDSRQCRAIASGDRSWCP